MPSALPPGLRGEYYRILGGLHFDDGQVSL